jgi:hypothetical protein
VQGTTGLHHEVTHTVFPPPDGLFDDATPFNAADDMLNRDPPAGHSPIERLLCRCQPAPLGLLDHPNRPDARQVTTQGPTVLH